MGVGFEMRLKSIPILLLLPALMLLVACGGNTGSPLPTYTPYPMTTPEAVVTEVPVDKEVTVVVTAIAPAVNEDSIQATVVRVVDGDTIEIEPWRAAAFPVLRDLVVDRTAFDNIIQTGGYVSVNTGSPPDGNSVLISQEIAEEAMDAAACIGCGACVASCKNASAMLFVSAKVKHLGILPQGQPERRRRVLAMVEEMQEQGFGDCSNEYECEAVCPKEISAETISFLNREFIRGSVKKH